MLRLIRIVLALVSIVAITLLFLDFTGFAATHWPWMAKIQFVPALLSLNLLALALIVGLTLLFGRIYCSVICPLGVFQDVVIRLRSTYGLPRRRQKNRFGYRPPYRRLRLTILTVFIVFILLGLVSFTASWIAGLIEPYSSYGRIVSQLFAPIYDGVNNLLADEAAARGSYEFYTVSRLTVWPVAIVAALTLVIIVTFAWVGGRNYCNIICPVGTVLGYLSRYSVFKPMIDKSKCNGCRKCERNCKASCIDGSTHRIDHTRCVVCMDCIGNCSQHAIKYRYAPGFVKETGHKEESASKPAVDAGRRSFITTGAIVGGALIASAAEHGDGALAPVKAKKRPERRVEVVPAGSGGVMSLSSKCTACQLCIQNCPEHILVPSTVLSNFMQPVMVYTDSYCRPGCTRCSEVCPAGAIERITPEEKTAIKIGTAVVDTSLCISASAGQQCGNCERRCPTGAVSMVRDEATGNMRPTVNENVCIGCGACEYNCPVGTVGHIKADHSAIHVEGIERHHEI